MSKWTIEQLAELRHVMSRDPPVFTKEIRDEIYLMCAMDKEDEALEVLHKAMATLPTPDLRHCRLGEPK